MNVHNQRLNHAQTTLVTSRLESISVKFEIDIRILTFANNAHEITDKEISEILAENRNHSA